MEKKVLMLILFFAFIIGMMCGIFIGINITIEKIIDGFDKLFLGSNTVVNFNFNGTEIVEAIYNLTRSNFSDYLM
jgi:amino acid permease